MSTGSGSPRFPRHASTARIWASQQLDLPLDATPSQIRDRFGDVLEREGLLPSPIVGRAFDLLQERRVSCDNLPFEGVNSQSAAAESRVIDQFASEFFGLPIAIRRDQWQELIARTECEENLQFLRHLESALELESGEIATAPPNVQTLLKELGELFVLRPRPRAVRRRELACNSLKGRLCQPRDALTLINRFPQWLKLDELYAIGIRKSRRDLIIGYPPDDIVTTIDNARIRQLRNRREVVEDNRESSLRTVMAFVFVALGWGLLGCLLYAMIYGIRGQSRPLDYGNPLRTERTYPTIPLNQQRHQNRTRKVYLPGTRTKADEDSMREAVANHLGIPPENVIFGSPPGRHGGNSRFTAPTSSTIRNEQADPLRHQEIESIHSEIAKARIAFRTLYGIPNDVEWDGNSIKGYVVKIPDRYSPGERTVIRHNVAAAVRAPIDKVTIQLLSSIKVDVPETRNHISTEESP